MAQNNGDIELVATLDESSSEVEILKAIKTLNNRIKNNMDSKIKIEAETDVRQLEQALNKIQKIIGSKNVSFNTKESIEGILKESAAMLEVVKSAGHAAKEKLEFANANIRVAESARDTANAVNNERNAMHSLNDINYILQNINMQGNISNNVFNEFGNTLRNAFYVFSAANLLQDAIYKIINAGKEAVSTVKELNDAAVSLRMATGDSFESVKSMMSTYNSMAQELGATTTSVAESANEWLRQSHTIEDTNKLIKDSIMLSKVSNLESAESTKYLTSAMQGYKVAVDDVVGIVDKLSSVDLESATDAGGLAEAMSRTAEGANIAGISMDRLLGMIATVGEVTQKSMSSIGESFKTIFSRMRDIKDDKLSVIGDDGEIEDLSNVEIVLDSLGIKLRSSNKEFRNFQEVLDEVAKSWGNYTSVQKAAIAKSFAGVRQQENFLVMMENWDKVKEYTNVAAESSGTATEKFEYYLEGIEAKTNNLKASLENLASLTISDELYESILDAGKAIVDTTAETGVLKGALAGLATAGAIYTFQHLATFLRDATQGFANLNEAMNMTRSGSVPIDDMQRLMDLTGGLSNSQVRLILSTDNLTDAQKIAILMNRNMTQAEAENMLQTYGLATAQQGAANATLTLSGAMHGLWSTLTANPLALVTIGVSAVVMAWNKYSQTMEEARQKAEEVRKKAVELTKEYNEQQSSLDSQITKYKELKASLDDSNLSADETRSIKEQLYEIQQSLIDSYGDEVSNIDLVNGKYKEQLGLLSEVSKTKATEYVNKNRDTFATAKEELEKARPYDIGRVTGWSSAIPQTEDQKKLVEFLNTYSDLLDLEYSHVNNSGISGTTIDLSVSADVETADKLMNKLAVDLEQFGKDNNIDVSGLLEGISGQLRETWTDELEEYKTIYDEFMKAEIVRNDILRPLYQQSVQAVEYYNKALSTGKGVTEAKANLESAQQAVQNVDDELKGSQNIFDSIFDGINKDAEAAYDLNMAFEKDGNVKKYAEQLRGLTDIDLKAINFDNDNIEKGEDAFKSLIEALGLTKEQAQNVIDKLVELGIVQGSGKTDNKSQLPKSFKDFWNSIGDTSKAADLKEELFKLASSGELTGDKLTELADKNKILKTAMDSTGLSAKNLAEHIRELNIKDIESGIDTFADALDKVKNKQSLTANETANLISLDNSLAGSVKKTKDGYLIEKDAISKALNSHKEKYNVAVSYEINETKNTIDRIQERLNAYKTEIEALKEAAKARNELAKESGSTTTGSYSDTLAQIALEEKQEKAQKKIDKKTKKLKELTDSLKNVTSSSSKNKNKSNEPTEIDWLSRRLTRMQSIIDLTATKFKNLFKIDEKENNINKQIKQTTQLIRQYSHAYDVYMAKFNKSTKASGKGKNRVPALSKDIIDKIISGEYTDESYSELVKKYGKKKADKINNAIGYYDKAQDARKNAESQKTNRLQLKKDKIQLRIDEKQSNIDVSELKKEEAVTAKAKNKILDNEKKYYKQLYNQKIKQAKLDKDSVEVEKLKLERQQKIKDIGQERLQNLIDEKQAELEVLGVSKDNTLTAQEKLDISARELAKKKEIFDLERKNAETDAERRKIDEDEIAYVKNKKLEDIGYITDEFDNNAASIDRDIAEHENKVNENEARGIGKSVRDYRKGIELSKEKQKNLRAEREILTNAFNDYINEQKRLGNEVNESDSVYREFKDTISECDNGIADCIVDQLGFNKAINEMSTKNYEAAIKLLDMMSDKFERLQSLTDVHNSKMSDEDLYEAISIGDEKIAENNKHIDRQKNNLRSYLSEVLQMSSDDINTFMDLFEDNPHRLRGFMEDLGFEDFNAETYKDIFDYMTDINDVEGDIYSAMVDQEQKLDTIIQNRADVYNDILENLKKQKEYKDRVFAIEKAQYDLEKAKNNLTKKVWDGSQWVYTADTEAVQSAQEAFDNAQYDELVNVIQDVIDVLTKSKDDINIYDDKGDRIVKNDKLKGYVPVKISEIFKGVDMDKFNAYMASNVPQFMPVPDIKVPEYISNISNNNNMRNMSVQNINISIPNITNASTGEDAAKAIRNELMGLFNYSKQYDWNK